MNEIARILQRKLVGKYIPVMNALNSCKPAKKEINPYILKNFFLGMSVMLTNKIREKKEQAFKNILLQFGTASTAVASDMKFKGKMLMGLKEYPRLNQKRAFWKWYLTTTATGENLFQKVSDNLVLYTNINKTTSFYR